MTNADRTDRIVSVCAIVAAIAAVAISAYEARITREYQRLSVWPRLEQYNSFVPGEPYTRTVANFGIGPALIQSVQMTVDGKTCRTWGEVIQALIGKPVPGHIYSSLHHGAVILPGKEVNILKIPSGENAQLFSNQVQGDRLIIRICYSSLFGESWLSDSSAEEPESVSRCTVDDKKEFKQ